MGSDVCVNFITTIFQILRNDVIDNINKFNLATVFESIKCFYKKNRTSRILSRQVTFFRLLAPGQVEHFSISTPLTSSKTFMYILGSESSAQNQWSHLLKLILFQKLGIVVAYTLVVKVDWNKIIMISSPQGVICNNRLRQINLCFIMYEHTPLQTKRLLNFHTYLQC